jgi:hypothetical protein
MHFRITTLAAAALLSLAVPAHGQDTDTVPRTSLREGAWSLSFAAPGYNTGGGSGELGAWKMVGPRTNLGFTLIASTQRSESSGGALESTDRRTDVTLNLNVKRYVTEPAEVTPFALVGAGIGYSTQDREITPGGPDQNASGYNGGVRAALGLEWFPVRRVSIAGYTGLAVVASGLESESDAPDGTPVPGESDGLFVGTFTSALSLQIWF